MKNYQITFQAFYSNGKSEIKNAILKIAELKLSKVKQLVEEQRQGFNERETELYENKVTMTSASYITHVEVPADWNEQKKEIEYATE